MNWYLLLQDLVQFLEAHENIKADKITVRGGTDGKAPETLPAIYVLRETEGGIPHIAANKRTEGECTFWVELWVKTTMDTDPLTAYEKLSSLESMFDDCLAEWSKALQMRLGVSAKVDLLKSSVGSEAFRPKYYGVKVIKITWNKR